MLEAQNMPPAGGQTLAQGMSSNQGNRLKRNVQIFSKPRPMLLNKRLLEKCGFEG